MSYCVIVTLTDKKEEAKKLALSLVEQKLAACVNIVQNVNSVYRWQNKISDETEYMLMIKTRKELFAQVKTYINNNHSYDLPACYMLNMDKGADEFFGWISENTINV